MSERQQNILEQAKCAVVRVGDGRGFVTDLADTYGHPMPCIVTAAHCVPIPDWSQPPWDNWENTKFKFVGLLDGDTTIAVTVLFWDPITDLAVLGAPDDQELFEEYAAYETFVEQVGRIPIAPLRLPLQARDAERTSSAWMLPLEGDWFACETGDNVLGLLVSNSEKPIVGGMFGSPIIDQTGAALGVVSRSPEGGENAEGYSTRLAICLPPRLTSTRPLMKF
jgi:hypothetical protein